MSGGERPPAAPRAPRAGIATVALISLAVAGLMVARIAVLRDLFDLMRTAARDPAWGFAPAAALAAVLAAIAAATGWLRGRKRLVGERLGYEHAHRWRALAYHALLTGTPRPGAGAGARLLRLSGDLGTLRRGISRGWARGVDAAVLVVVATAALALWNPALGATLLLAGIGCALASGRPAGLLQERQRRADRRRRRLADHVAEHVNHPEVVRHFGRAAGEARRLQRVSRRLTDAVVGVTALRARLQALAVTLSGATTAAVALVGLFEVGAGRATPGLAVAAVLVARQLSSPFRSLLEAPAHRRRAAAAERRVRATIAATAGRPARKAQPLSLGAPGIAVRHAVLTGRVELAGLAVDPGTRLAIFGPNGSGKTSVLRLLAGAETPDSGAVRIDQKPVHRHARTRRRIAMAGPDLPLLRGSLARNLRYRDRRADDAEVRAALVRVGLADLPERLADGWATVVSADTSLLSRGELRRLEIARALVGRPDLLLLDDPFTGLDADGRRRLRGIIETFPGTVAWTAADTRDLEGADAVWRLDSGRVVGGRSAATPTAPSPEAAC